jgi:hypothetical protein
MYIPGVPWLLLLRHNAYSVPGCVEVSLGVLCHRWSPCSDLFYQTAHRTANRIRRVELPDVSHSRWTDLHDSRRCVRRSRIRRNVRRYAVKLHSSLPRRLVYLLGLGVPYDARP